MKLTPWFSVDMKPVRPGVYKTRLPLTPGRYLRGFSYWSGAEWHRSTLGVDAAAANGAVGACQSKEWRGLANKP